MRKFRLGTQGVPHESGRVRGHPLEVLRLNLECADWSALSDVSSRREPIAVTALQIKTLPNILDTDEGKLQNARTEAISLNPHPPRFAGDK